MGNVTHIETRAGVRYWEDATVNGVEDEDGSLIPGKNGDHWCVRIRLEDGVVENWPDSTTADIHYKVCDDGEYWLTDADGRRLAYREGYVPEDFLCHGDSGYGDYIIMSVGEGGKIARYTRPDIGMDDWESVE